MLKVCLLVLVLLVPANGWFWGRRSGSRRVSTTSIGTKVRNIAVGHVGSTHWSYASGSGTGTNSNKCNQFVADVYKAAGITVPQRRWWKWSPIGANEWKNPASSYLLDDGCWRVVSSPQNGDVRAGGGHVGIVTGHRETTSAAHDNVVRNDWGFRSGQTTTTWRYKC